MAPVTIVSGLAIAGRLGAIVTTSGGTIYVFIIDALNGPLRIFKSITGGASWSELSSVTSVTIHGGTGNQIGGMDAAVDSSGYIHVLCASRSGSTTRDLAYATLNTSNDSWSAWEAAASYTDSAVVMTEPVQIGIALDSNSKPHILFLDQQTSMGTAYWQVCYTNKTGASWLGVERVSSSATKNYKNPCIEVRDSNTVVAIYDDDYTGVGGHWRERTTSWGTENTTDIGAPGYAWSITTYSGGSYRYYKRYSNSYPYENTTAIFSAAVFDWRMAGVLIGTKRYFFYCLTTDTKLYYRTNDGSGWSAPINLVNVAIGNLKVEYAYNFEYQSGKINYVYGSSDNKTFYYDSVSTGSASTLTVDDAACVSAVETFGLTAGGTNLVVQDASCTTQANSPTTTKNTGLVVADCSVSPYLNWGLSGNYSIIDNFNRADGPLGSDWTALQNTVEVVGNAAKGITGYAVNQVRWASGNFGPGIDICFTVLTDVNTQLGFRYSENGTTYYELLGGIDPRYPIFALYRRDPDQHLLINAAQLNLGADYSSYQLRLRHQADGTVQFFYNLGAGWVQWGATAVDNLILISSTISFHLYWSLGVPAGKVDELVSYSGGGQLQKSSTLSVDDASCTSAADNVTFSGAPIELVPADLASETTIESPTLAVTLTLSVADCAAECSLDSPVVEEIPTQDYNPVGDLYVGSWSNELLSGTNLFQSIDESTAGDGDYIQSEPNPSGSACAVALAGHADPEVSYGHFLAYRYGKEAVSDPLNLTVQLRQGYVDEGSPGTLIAQWVHNDVPVGFTTVEQELTPAQTDSITDYNALSVRMVAG